MKGYGLDQKTYIQIMKDRLDSFGTDINDDFQLMDCRCSYDEEYSDFPEDLKSIDTELITMADKLSAVEINHDEDHWIWFMDEISKGTYPLNKLPEHVRKLAEELYY